MRGFGQMLNKSAEISVEFYMQNFGGNPRRAEISVEFYMQNFGGNLRRTLHAEMEPKSL